MNYTEANLNTCQKVIQCYVLYNVDLSVTLAWNIIREI